MAEPKETFKSKYIPPSVWKSMIEGVTMPDAADIVSHFIELSGGAKGFAQLLFATMESASTNANTKARIMDMILRLMEKVDPGSKIGDLGMLNDHDLESELQQALGQMSEPELVSGETQMRIQNGSGQASETGAQDANA